MGTKPWVLRWVYGGSDPDQVRDPVAAILPGTTPIDEVARIAEMLYANNAFTLSERLALAEGTWTNPYPPGMDRQRERISCGHHPYIEAHRMRNARVIGSDQEETLEFD